MRHIHLVRGSLVCMRWESRPGRLLGDLTKGERQSAEGRVAGQGNSNGVGTVFHTETDNTYS